MNCPLTGVPSTLKASVNTGERHRLLRAYSFLAPQCVGLDKLLVHCIPKTRLSFNKLCCPFSRVSILLGDRLVELRDNIWLCSVHLWGWIVKNYRVFGQYSRIWPFLKVIWTLSRIEYTIFRVLRPLSSVEWSIKMVWHLHPVSTY